MKKQKFIDALLNHSTAEDHRGQLLLVHGIAAYIEMHHGNEEEEYINWLSQLKYILADAFYAFKTLDVWGNLRHEYWEESGHDIPTLLLSKHQRIDEFLGQHLLVESLISFFDKASQQWIGHEVKSYFEAESNCIHQAWHQFVRLAYRPMMEMLKASSYSRHSGQYGSVEVATLWSAGRVHVCFAQGEDMISYIIDQSDDTGFRSGLCAKNADYIKCIMIIREVIANWDIEKLEASRDT